MRSQVKKRIITIVGPTAVGKTSLSIALAGRMGAEIVSADSRLFYRSMDVGTDKPALEERRAVRHHLVDILEPDDQFSISSFQDLAYQAIDEILAGGRPAFVVGGSGQYIRAIIEGWLPPKYPPEPGLRSRLENLGEKIGPSGLHKMLVAIDPAAALSIDYRNMRRVVRALEVIFRSGQKFSSQSRRMEPRYEVLQIGLTRPREVLYRRIDERIRAMMENGLLDETRVLLEKGYSPDLPSLSAIGYAEAVRTLRGEFSEAEAIRRIGRRTRTLVRRQANWFKADDPDIHWFDAQEEPIDHIENLIRGFI